MATVLLEFLTPPSAWTAVDLPYPLVTVRLVAHARGGIPTLALEAQGGPLPGLPDPWLGKTVRLSINGTLRFFGDVVRADPIYGRFGWLVRYQALGIRNRGDWIPHTDSNNGGDSSAYNLASDNQGPDYLPSRAGRTVGEILLDVLSGGDNASTLIGVGIGNYTSPGFGAAGVVTMAGTAVASIAVAAGGGGTGYSVAPLVVLIGGGMVTPAVVTASVSGGAVTGFTVTSGGHYSKPPGVLVTTLPATTVADLVAMVFQPPGPCYFGGEKLLSAVEGFLSGWAPNYVLHVEPGGDLRFLDVRLYTAHTLTFGAADRVELSPISRDLGECFQRVRVRGPSLAEMFRFSTKLGTLSESPFAHDGLTVAQAKTAWVPDDYFRPELTGGRVEGTCTVPSTTTVTITSALATTAFAADAYDQTITGRHGMMSLTYSAGVDITMIAQRMVVANTAMAAGGTSDVTVDRALPHLLFDHFTMTGLTLGASAVWVDYALPAWAAPKVALQSYLPFPLKYANGNAETLISSATGVIRWSSSGNPPYQEGISGISIDAGSGIIRFNYPTRLTAGKQPDDVEAWIPIYVDVNQAVWPADVGGLPQYAGTSHTVDGLTKTLTVTIPQWRDPANLQGMLLFAADLLDSVKDVVCEGVITYLGLYEPALAPGTAYSLTGDMYATGWEGLALTNTQTELTWDTDGLTWITSIRVSSRRAHFSAEAFLHPDRTGVTFDWGSEVEGVLGSASATSGLAALSPFSVEGINAAQAANVGSQVMTPDVINAASTAATTQFTQEAPLTQDVSLTRDVPLLDQGGGQSFGPSTGPGMGGAAPFGAAPPDAGNRAAQREAEHLEGVRAASPEARIARARARARRAEDEEE